MNINRKTQDAFFYLIGLSAIGFYSNIIYQHAYNIPKWDDFQEILRFLDRWLSANTLCEKFSIFISQNNEHILLVNHSITLFQYYLVGHLDFAWLIYIGNAFYIGSALMLWLFFKNHTERSFCFAVIMLTGVTFYAYDSTLWAMTAISNQAVIFFSFLAIHLVSRERENIILTMLVSSCAVFSQSNGIFLLLVIGGYFYIIKDWLNLKYWGIFSTLIIGLYAYWFNPASQQDNHLLSIIHQIPLQNYFLTMPAFLTYFGASIFTDTNIASIIISLLTGILIIGITLIQIKKQLYPTEILLIIAFLLLSILSITAYRGLVLGPQVVFISRYKMYGAYFLVTGVLLSPFFILKLQESTKWKASILLISVIYFAWSFPGNLKQAAVIDGDLFKSLQHWVEDGDFRHARGYFVKDADSYLFAALKNKTYTPMVLLPEESIIHKIEVLPYCPFINNQMTPVTEWFFISHKNPNAAGIKIISKISSEEPATITLCSEQQSYQFEIRNPDNESSLFIARENIFPGTYLVWIKKSGVIYKLETPFINKIASR